MNTRGELLLHLRAQQHQAREASESEHLQRMIDWVRVHTRDETDTTPNVPQPAPVATNRRPCWDTVIEQTEKRRGANAYSRPVNASVLDLVLADMRERNAVGMAKYGVPLTAGNGRVHLIDTYQEKLDAAVYLIAELDEHGIGPDVYAGPPQFAPDVAWKLHLVQRMFHETVDHIIRLRALIAGEGNPL